MKRRDFLKSLGVAGAAGMAPGSLAAAPQAGPGLGLDLKTKHVIVILNGNGARKKEYYENAEMSPNIARMAKEGFVYAEDGNDTTSNHGNSWTSLITGNEYQSGVPQYPTIPHYVRKHAGDAASNYWYIQGVSYYRMWRYNVKYYTSHPEYGIDTRPAMLTTGQAFFEDQKLSPAEIVAQQFTEDMGLTRAERVKLEQFVGDTLSDRSYIVDRVHKPIPRSPFWEEAQALQMIPSVLKEFKPKMLIFQQTGHDTGHGAGGLLRDETGWFEYSKVIQGTDEGIGQIIDFVKNDPYFSKNTAIVMRPEFGRDDEVNLYGEIHHSEGYYYCQQTASIWYGPDFKPGVSNELVNRKSFAPTVAAMFNAPAPYAQGAIHKDLWAPHVGYAG